jgi:hypothetical protein
VDTAHSVKISRLTVYKATVSQVQDAKAKVLADTVLRLLEDEQLGDDRSDSDEE